MAIQETIMTDGACAEIHTNPNAFEGLNPASKNSKSIRHNKIYVYIIQHTRKMSSFCNEYFPAYYNFMYGNND